MNTANEYLAQFLGGSSTAFSPTIIVASMGLALLLALLLVIFDDIRKNSVIWGIFGSILLIFLSTKEAAILSMPLLSAYTTFRASEGFEGKKSYAVAAAGFLLFILACSFDGLFGIMY